MAMRAATMNPMIAEDHAATVREPSHFFRKLVLLSLLVAGAALWIVILFENQAQFPLLLSTIFADLCLGLITGFGSRAVLRKRGMFTQSLMGILLAIFGMIFIGSISKWVLGIGPIALQPDASKQISTLQFGLDLPDQVRSLTIEPRELFDFQKMDWADPIHLLASLLMTLMSLYAWRGGNAATQAIEVMPLAPEVSITPAPRVSFRTNQSERPRIGSRGGLFARLQPSSSSGIGLRSRNGTRSTILKEPKVVSDQRNRSKRKRTRQRSHISFALVEEHRCPYCLDDVNHNDVRGVKECEVCHTLHHADCWAITGVCQVPHLNT